MRQLNGIDASFLNMEPRSTYGHVSSLNIFDPAGVAGGAGVEAMKQLILERIDQLTPFRRRLIEVPLGLDLPYWIEDPAFDIDFHVRHHAVAPPGTPEQLGEIISRIHGRPLDRRRPLWELYVIEGVDGGRLHRPVHQGAYAGDRRRGRGDRCSLRSSTPTPARVPRASRARGHPTASRPIRSCCSGRSPSS